jgi:hypothetical protein
LVLLLVALSQRRLHFTSRPGKVSYALALCALLESAGALYFTPIVRARVMVRDSAISFLFFDGALVVLLALSAITACAGSRQHRGLSLMLSGLSLIILVVTVAAN